MARGTDRGGNDTGPPLDPGPQGPAGERLQKVLARAGVGSRRVCDDLVSAGRVTVNGERAVAGQRVDPHTDLVAVDGVPVPVAPDLVYYLVNKPTGVVTTASDPEGRRTVLDLVPVSPRVFPVGRLDYDTEALILLTNDGELAHRLSHPSHGVAKEYLAEVEGTPGPGALRRLREGIDLDDGRTGPAVVGQAAPGVVRIVIHEGRNRQVRRMLDAVGHPVRRLVRTRIGPVTDTALRPGRWRVLRGDEVRALYAESAKSHDPEKRPASSGAEDPAPAGRAGDDGPSGRERPPR
ncbi:MAG TPA: pseudouridine synthase [Acidimicrobiales bacterium]|nr:pseudouridine synthase [Acidimicrobiales bacterium]